MKQRFSSQLMGNLACFLAYLIFGFNIVACKSISECGLISPMALYLMRAIGALLLFWLMSLFWPTGQKMVARDLWKVAIASFFGLFLTQLSFLKAITMTTAVDASILSLMSPIMAMIVAAIVLHDPITRPGVIGLTVSFAGVLFIILHTTSIRSGASTTTLPGVLLMLVNTLSFALYVGIFRPLIKRYDVVTFMKWMFLFSTLYAIPFGIDDLRAVPYGELSGALIAQVLYVVIGATFISYFLIPIGQKRIRPMIVCMYSYVQPVIAMVVSLAVGLDTMSFAKGAATLLVFVGVGIVNFVPKKNIKQRSSDISD